MTSLEKPRRERSSDVASPSSETPWHTLALEDVAKRLLSDPERGLTAAEAKKRLAEHGPNVLTQAEGRSIWAILVAQFQSLIVVLLVVAAAIALSLGEHIEAGAILVVIVLNAAIGFFTEWQAERALTALQKQIVPTADVIRDGADHRIEASQLTPGDLVVLTAGDRTPADGRIVESARLQIEEAALTGESHAVVKSIDPVKDEHAPLGDRVDMAFMGTTITDGRGLMLVTAIGSATEMGKIGRLIDEAVSRDTPLEQKLAKLGRLLVVIVLALCAVIVVAGWLRGASDFWHMLELGVSLAIAAVPEGLPAVATMTLALGMQRMAKMGALVRRLPAVETLGSTTIICTDKTGTLTKNEMTASVLVLPGRRFEISGVGHEAKGEFRAGEQVVDPRTDERLLAALRIGVLCNDSHIERAEETRAVGDPTETALVVAGEKAGLHRSELERDYPREDESPFDSDSKHMVTVHRTPEGAKRAYVKGSPGKLLELSTRSWKKEGEGPLTDEDREYWKKANEELAGAALRVLALAVRDLPDDYTDDDLHKELTYVGLVG
ncbi:MAG TPA: HAD-IC family P-type ATPase, partial [Pirellulales bacterium]